MGWTRLSWILGWVALATGCDGGASASRPPTSGEASQPESMGTVEWSFAGKAPDGSTVAFGVAAGRLVATDPLSAPAIDLGQRFVVPAFIDSHVHLSYLPVADQLATGGIVAAVDFAMPLRDMGKPLPLEVLYSGPMLTPPLGYPTQSWGSDGYGYEVATAAAARAAVDELLANGASFVKVALPGEFGLDDERLDAVVERAHGRGVLVAAHATGAGDAERAIAHGVDVLAHTPTEALPAELFSGLEDLTVVSTLDAFGGGTAAVANLAAFRAAGARILYGTDLGNSQQPAIQVRELERLVDAGLDGQAIVAAGTSSAAEFWGFGDLGELAPGRRASFLVLDENPVEAPLGLATPRAVVVDGKLVSGSLE